MLCLTNVTLLSITTPCARTTGAHSASPWSWANAATPVMAAEKSGSDEHQAEQRPHSVATHRSISRPVGSATREHVGTASTVTNHREQRRFLAHFQQLSGPEHAHGSPRGLDGASSSSRRIRRLRWRRWLHFTASLRASSDDAGVNVRVGEAWRELSARRPVPFRHATVCLDP